MSATSHSLRLLIVEDHHDTAMLLSTLLELRGHEVEVAENVEDALRLAGQQQFDLVVSDVGPPDASGYDLMRQLREQMPIRGIAISGRGGPDDIKRSRDAGFSEHLTKPVGLKKLEQAIGRVIGESRSPATG